mmetsp:Transcript_35447/g.76537  ORF Transcript_35447/g.76537 Transcript_35447/m.76537 type:complete len:219 (+) Transcript_35447:318-974(+)
MSVPSDTATGAVRNAPAARQYASGFAVAWTARSFVTMPGKKATMDPTAAAMRAPTRIPTDSNRSTNRSLARFHSFLSTVFPFCGLGRTWKVGRKDCAICEMTSMNGLAKKKSDNAIWCAASVAGWPGRPAAALVMNPNADILPMIRVRTGAANLRNVLLLMASGAPPVTHRGSRPNDDPFASNLRRAGPIMAMVPASCAHNVAMAAPFNPMWNLLTSK